MSELRNNIFSVTRYNLGAEAATQYILIKLHKAEMGGGVYNKMP